MMGEFCLIRTYPEQFVSATTIPAAEPVLGENVAKWAKKEIC